MRRVLHQCRAHQLIDQGDLVLVAVSGGQDSLCLLDALATVREPLVAQLHVAHVDHGLRGREAEADARYVAEVAKAYGLPVTVASVDVGAYKRQHRLGTQVAARYARYQVLAQVARRVGAASVAVGHTRDDLVETLLMNLLRGTGLRGLAGIPPRQELRVGLLGPPLSAPWQPDAGASLVVIRPLLEVERRQTLAYCQAAGLSPRVDTTNHSPAYRRNRVRAELVPVLERFNPSIRASLARTAEVLRGDLEVIEATADAAWDRLARPTADGIVLERTRFAAEPISIRRQLIRLAVERVSGTTDGLRWAAVEAAVRLAGATRATWRLDLSTTVESIAEYDRLLVRRKAPVRAGKAEPATFEPALLPVPGRVDLGEAGAVEARTESMPAAEEGSGRPATRGDRFRVYVDADKLTGPLRVRPRLAGDRMVPLGLRHSKKLQDILVDAKVPRRLRGLVPVVESAQGIVWLAGLRVDERFRLTDDTRRVLVLSYTPGQSLAALGKSA